MTDYLSELEDQLGRVTESGIHNRRQLGSRVPHPKMGVLAAVTSILVVVAVVAVAFITGGGGRSRRPALRAAGNHPARGEPPVGARRSAGGIGTKAGGGTSYCVNSMTHARTACSPRTAPFPNGAATWGGFLAIRPDPGSPVRLAAQLYLHPRSGAKRPTAAALVVEQGGAFGVTIVGVGLPASTKRDAYAVWITNRRLRGVLDAPVAGVSEPKLLGFVNPGVKTNGRLKTAGILPKDAFRYHELLITLETQANPTAPGAIALEGSFHR